MLTKFLISESKYSVGIIMFKLESTLTEITSWEHVTYADLKERKEDHIEVICQFLEDNQLDTVFDYEENETLFE